MAEEASSNVARKEEEIRFPFLLFLLVCRFFLAVKLLYGVEVDGRAVMRQPACG